MCVFSEASQSVIQYTVNHTLGSKIYINCVPVFHRISWILQRAEFQSVLIAGIHYDLIIIAFKEKPSS